MTDRPRSSKEFQRLLQRHAADLGQLPQRVMHLVRVGVVCAMLDDAHHDDGGHLFIVKGGTAMQLRLGIEARATTDLDVAFRGRFDDWLARFDTATACTEPRPGGNDRVRDVIDIWLLEALLEPGRLAEVRAAATETFGRRKLHSWPPAVAALPSWTSDYARLVDAHADAPADVDEAVRYLADLIERIDNAH